LRKKTEEKLQQIIEVAARLFIEKGFSETSMSEIADSVGGSKATLYSYFPSKFELFTEVMLQSAGKLGGKIFDVLDSPLPLREKLQAFGQEYLTFALSQPMIDIRRTVLAELHKLANGHEIYERGIKKKWGRLATIFDAAMAKGEMKQANSWVAAMQLRALFETDLMDCRILGIKDGVSKEEIKQAVERALAMFWNSYAV